MSTQPEALRLAEWWEQQSHNHALTPESKTATELRRLHESNLELMMALEQIEIATACKFSLNIIRAAINKAEGGTNEL